MTETGRPETMETNSKWDKRMVDAGGKTWRGGGGG
jgi:hypothetical protein